MGAPHRHRQAEKGLRHMLRRRKPKPAQEEDVPHFPGGMVVDPPLLQGPDEHPSRGLSYRVVPAVVAVTEQDLVVFTEHDVLASILPADADDTRSRQGPPRPPSVLYRCTLDDITAVRYNVLACGCRAPPCVNVFTVVTSEEIRSDPSELSPGSYDVMASSPSTIPDISDDMVRTWSDRPSGAVRWSFCTPDMRDAQAVVQLIGSLWKEANFVDLDVR
eukprot:NODE_779_length_776_cov_482.423659_g596_i0.p1 GENE.NODE_779_length_776_cov_482.423659_g596_i0~~NODE_779_length_776_cov_482.423659_g596_i0.p1  ORF type:complete len:226 (-),score=62.43 NODE_779_length_776_cov_482.423659_g596_i0:97-750(-)